LILGVTGFIGFNYFMPDYYFRLYPLIPLFFVFIVIGSCIVLIFIKKRKSVIDLKTYTILRTVKFLLFLVCIFLYSKIVDSNNVAFAIVFMLFYMISLSLESWLFMKINSNV
jgi:hypothetical protein